MSSSAPPLSSPSPGSRILGEIFLDVARAVDGGVLVREALAGARVVRPTAILALGKVAFPMCEGLVAATGAPPARGLLIAPASRFPNAPQLPSGTEALVSDHPDPSERSVAAGRAALGLVSSLRPEDELLVLLSGGGSSLMAAPAEGLSLAEKRAGVKAVARGGATIHELNCVRKHLSAVKGGRLALATRARTTVLALSDVVGDDPGTIASGPFSPDPTTFAEALALVERLGPSAPEAVRAHLLRGARGELAETPKPGTPALGHVRYEVVAGPQRVVVEAERAAASRGLGLGDALPRNTEDLVQDLARLYGARARAEHAAGGSPRVLVGNGEPRIVVTGDGRGGRATHLALLVAREIAGLTDVAFLAAGTDDRDGSTDASGAVVDGDTWERALRAGLDPEGALTRCDSETPLAALGCLVRGPGTSNLLDLHLLAVGR